MRYYVVLIFVLTLHLAKLHRPNHGQYVPKKPPHWAQPSFSKGETSEETSDEGNVNDNVNDGHGNYGNDGDDSDDGSDVNSNQNFNGFDRPPNISDGDEDSGDDDYNEQEYFELKQKEKKKPKKKWNKDVSDDNYDTYDTIKDEENLKNPHYLKELLHGDPADINTDNKHYYVPTHYKWNDFGRRQFEYGYDRKDPVELEKEVELNFDDAVQGIKKKIAEDSKKEIIPKKASPEIVLALAKQSAKYEASKPLDPSLDIIQKNILRSGEYWDNVWKEEPDTNTILRSQKKPRREKVTKPKLEVIRVKIMPGSKLHKLASFTKQISPRLLYIINSDQ